MPPFRSTRQGPAARRGREFAWLLAAAAVVALRGPGARAELVGGIEIGAKGVKATVVDLVADSDGYEVAVKLADTTNTTLVAGLAQTEKFDPKAVEETAAAVGRYYKQMKADFGVKPERIYIVGSSGLFSPLQDNPDQVRADQKTLGEAVRGVTGASMTFIDSRREAELSVTGVVPRKYRAEAVLIDVGSGNTKGGYVGTGNQFSSVGVPYGTVSFADLVARAGGSFPDQARKLREEKLAPALKKELSTAAEMTTRRRVYLSGGIVWATATLTHPEDTRAFTPLGVGDIDDLHKRLAAEPGKFPETDLSAIADEGKRQQARAEVEKVKKVYTPEQLLAGVQILKALADEMQLGAGEKQVYFARHGSLAWILAYVAEKGAGPK
jgi:hypothetical protein